MSQFTIEGGHNPHDPIRDYLHELPTAELWHPDTIPGRSTALFEDALKLAKKLPSGSFVDKFGEGDDGQFIVISEAVSYKTPSDGEANIWLETSFPISAIGGLIVGEGTELQLMTDSDNNESKWIYALTSNGMFRNSFGERAPAGHGDINFFDIVVLHKVKEAFFPKK